MGRVGLLRKEIVQRHPAYTLCAVCDPRPPAQKDREGAEYYEDYHDLIDSDLDAVFIATPNKFTPGIAAAALRAKKHVFCEKPPGRTLEDVHTIIAAEKASGGRVLKFGFNHRYHGSVMEAKKIIDSGELGRALWIRGVYGKSGGVKFEKEWRSSPDIAGVGILLDQGIHMLDLFRYFLGDFSEVKSFVATSCWNIGLEDNAFALMRTEKNQIASIHSSSTQWKHTFLMEIGLMTGYITLSGILSSTRSYGQGERLIVAKRQLEDEAKAVGNPQETLTSFDQDRSWEIEIDEFATCINEGRRPLNGTSSDAYAVMKLIEDIYRDGNLQKTGN